MQRLELFSRRLGHLYVEDLVLHGVDRHAILLHPPPHPPPQRRLRIRDLRQRDLAQADLGRRDRGRAALVFRQEVAERAPPQQQQREESIAAARQVQTVDLEVARARRPLHHLAARLVEVTPAVAARSVRTQPLVHLYGHRSIA